MAQQPRPVFLLQLLEGKSLTTRKKTMAHKEAALWLGSCNLPPPPPESMFLDEG